MTQVNELNHEIRVLTRQRDRLAKAADLLAPVGQSGTRTRNAPNGAERTRRREVLITFLSDWRKGDNPRNQFSAGDIVYCMGEPNEMMKPYQTMLLSAKWQDELGFELATKGNKGSYSTFRLV
jgi:hypothetical protein